MNDAVVPVPDPTQVLDGLIVVLPPRHRMLLEEMARRAHLSPEAMAAQLIADNLYVADYSPEMPFTELMARLGATR